MSRIDIGQNITKPKVVPATAKAFFAAADSKKTGRICAELLDALEQTRRGELTPEEYKDIKAKKKRGCMFYTPHAHFQKGYKRSDGEPVDSGKAVIDLDGCEHFPQLYEELLKGREKELGINMANISVSGTGGHILFDIPEGLTRQEAQAWMANEILGGVDYDKAVHEKERAIYIPCRDYILYLDEELMFSDETHGAKGVPTVPSVQEVQEVQEENSEPCILNSELKFRNIPYCEIVRQWWDLNGGEPQEGERNVKLYQLAVNLRSICDNNKALLLKIMPRLGLGEQELKSIVDSACKETPKGISKMMQEILSSEESKAKSEEPTASPVPPQMPEKLPKLIQLLVSKTPDVYKAAVAHAVFPPLATHLCGVRFRYTDNVEHEATLMNCLMAGTGAGKGCIDKPIERIMADIERRDKENEQREAEWKKDCQKRGANKDKLLRPEGLVIQIIDPDMTKPALVTRMDESEGHFVYVKLNELDLFEQLKGQTGKQHFQLMCLAFDPEAEYGQTRVGTQSVTARPKCRFNWNACSTILKGRRFFRNVLTDGPISRINFCTIPEQEIGSEQPVYGQYDTEFDEALKPYIDKLGGARGLIDCPQAYRLAQKLQQECAEFARLSQNETYWNLSHRACVIAWLKACVLYVANGMKWEKSIEDFIRWSLEYDLWCKMQFFGADIERATHGEDSRIGTRGPKNLLGLLPDEFSIEDAKRVRRQEGMSNDENRALKMIRTWINRGYVIQNTEYSFLKSARFSK